MRSIICKMSNNSWEKINGSHWPEPVSHTLLTNPISKASLALTSRPVSIRSRARDKPISFGSRTVPPSTNGTPVTVKYTADQLECFIPEPNYTSYLYEQ